MKLSIIIPAGPGDSSYLSLLRDLNELPQSWEIILVSPDPANKINNGRLRHVLGNGKRADQLNLGGSSARGEFLWFLHSDSRVGPAVIERLKAAVEEQPDHFHYFALEFLPDGPGLAKLNGFLANVRSHIFKIPFGDQGFALKKSLWQQCGTFVTNRAYGEDHAFVWQLRRRKVGFSFHRHKIKTSSRKYSRHGWLRTSTIHNILTWKQVSEELVKWVLLELKTKKSFNREVPREQ